MVRWLPESPCKGGLFECFAAASTASSVDRKRIKKAFFVNGYRTPDIAKNYVLRNILLHETKPQTSPFSYKVSRIYKQHFLTSCAAVYARMCLCVVKKYYKYKYSSKR